MEMALQFNELTADELLYIDGGADAYDVGYTVGKLLGIVLTCAWCCVGLI